MAIITCPECGNQVSDKAQMCPHCGISIAKDSSVYHQSINGEERQIVNKPPKTWLIALIITVAIFALLAICLFAFSGRYSGKEGESQSENSEISLNSVSNEGGKYVVIDGSQLRLRLTPSTDGETFKWKDGSNRHPKKGEKFLYLEETDGFYQIDFHGNRLWVSKSFSHIENGNELKVENGNRQQKSPQESNDDALIKLKVTPNSVGPIYIGEPVSNVPLKGDFYDRMENRYEWTNITDLYKGNEKVLELRHDNGKIFLISICSPKISLDNGIHVGMTGYELETRYNAKITPKFEVELQWIEYKVPGYNSYTLEGDLPLGDYSVDFFTPTSADNMPGCKLDRIYLMKH